MVLYTSNPVYSRVVGGNSDVTKSSRPTRPNRSRLTSAFYPRAAFVESWVGGRRKREAGCGTATEAFEAARSRKNALEGRALDTLDSANSCS